jgi:hypothetical protein
MRVLQHKLELARVASRSHDKPILLFRDEGEVHQRRVRCTRLIVPATEMAQFCRREDSFDLQMHSGCKCQFHYKQPRPLVARRCTSSGRGGT